MSRCLQHCARGSEHPYLPLRVHPNTKLTSSQGPPCISPCACPFPLSSCRLVLFAGCSNPQQISFSATAGSCSLFLTFGEEAALARRALVLMGAQKLNPCPNPAHLAVMTNRILFWKRREGKKRGSPYSFQAKHSLRL